METGDWTIPRGVTAPEAGVPGFVCGTGVEEEEAEEEGAEEEGRRLTAAKGSMVGG